MAHSRTLSIVERDNDKLKFPLRTFQVPISNALRHRVLAFSLSDFPQQLLFSRRDEFHRECDLQALFLRSMIKLNCLNGKVEHELVQRVNVSELHISY